MCLLQEHYSGQNKEDYEMGYVQVLCRGETTNTYKTVIAKPEE